VFVPIQPIDGAKRDDCFGNTSLAIEALGGQQKLGWRIGEEPFRFLEAEFHSVWLTPGGDLIDVTPNPIGTEVAMFVHDPARRYQGQQTNTVRLTLTDEPVLEEVPHDRLVGPLDGGIDHRHAVMLHGCSKP